MKCPATPEDCSLPVSELENAGAQEVDSADQDGMPSLVSEPHVHSDTSMPPILSAPHNRADDDMPHLRSPADTVENGGTKEISAGPEAHLGDDEAGKDADPSVEPKG